MYIINKFYDNFLKTMDTMICDNILLKNLPKLFDSITKNLTSQERHFRALILRTNTLEKDFILSDNSFGQITFDLFYGDNIKKISLNAFNNSADKITHFSCQTCLLVNEPPKYGLNSVFNRMTHLEKILSLRLNVTELPTSTFELTDGRQSNLSSLTLGSYKNITVKSGAFQNLVHLKALYFNQTTLRFEKEAFKFANSSNNTLTILFDQCNLKSE